MALRGKLWCARAERRSPRADSSWNDSRGSYPPAPGRGKVAGLRRRQAETAGGTHAGRAAAGDGGTDPQLHGWCTFGAEGRRCAESEHAGAEGTFAVGRFGEGLGAAEASRDGGRGRPALPAASLKPTFALPASAPAPARVGLAIAPSRSVHPVRD